ncbi:MAG TPA: protein kinase [Bryobacteraceae bacterium]|nr:protein kinase [Bryobacteraceae bacterium]
MDRIGRYKIVRELGRGAMGVVYLAIDPTIGRNVAIKTIRLGEVNNPEERARLRERLFREARSAGVLSHPGIVTIYDMEAQDDLAYIAMEYVNGPTLDQLLTGQPMPAERLFSILGQTAVALDYAHQKGIVHRDIKPANIMITEDGSAKITDFGIAKINTNEQFTMTGAIVGTPHYMAPEQVQGLAVDGRADQFSLAVIVFEMLTGEKPFTGEQLTTVVYKIVAEEPVPAHRLNATLNQQITNVLRRALSKKPEARYPNCQKFVDALEAACAAAKGWQLVPRGGSLNLPTAVEAPRPRSVSPSRTTEETKPRQRRQVGILQVVMAILVAAGLVVLIAWQAAPWLTGSFGAKQPQAAAQPAVPQPPPTVTAPPEEKKTGPVPEVPATEAPAKEAPATAPQTPATAPAAAGPPPSEPANPAPESASQTPERGPIPAPATAERPRSQPPHHAPTDLSASPYVKVNVSTIPPDATAMLDDRPDTACTTPCALDSLPGPHMVTITRQGYQTEHRPVTVTDTGADLAPVAMRVPGGVLMLASDPSGARIYINGTLRDRVTPAKLDLPPGRYTIAVERDGKRASKEVVIQNGITHIERIVIGR